MAGLFDDLIPQAQQAGGAFDDLVPQQPANRLLEAVRKRAPSPTTRNVMTEGANTAPAFTPRPPSMGEFASAGKNLGVGALAGIPGIPGDVEGLARSGLSQISNVSPQTMLPTTEDIGNRMAGPPQNAMEAGSRMVGSMLGPGAAMKGLRALKIPVPAPKLPAAPTRDELRAASAANYKAVDNAGVIIGKDSWNKFADDLKASLADKGLDAGLHPDATSAFKRIDAERGNNITLKGAEILRRVALDATKAQKPADAEKAGVILNHLDDYMDNIPDAELVGGDSSKIPLLKDARDTWKRMRKSDDLQALVDRADTRAASMNQSKDQAIKTEFRQLAMNANRMKRFDKTEQALIKSVAGGGVGLNALREMARFSPRGPVGAMSGMAATGTMGLGGAVLPAVGEASRAAASAITARRAQRAIEQARRGSQTPSPALPPPLTLGNRYSGYDPLAIGLIEGYGNAPLPFPPRRQNVR